MSKSAPPDYEVGYGKPPKKHRFRDRGSFVDPVLKLESGFVNRHDATAGA
jgi:hypothetical protein